MANLTKLIEDLYLTFQFVITLIIIYLAFPLFGKSQSDTIIYFAVVCSVYLMIRLVYYVIYFSDDHQLQNKNFTLLTSIIDGILLMGFILIQSNTSLPYSHFVLVYVLLQTIRLADVRKFLIVFIAIGIDFYLLMISDMASRNFIDLIFNGILYIFISFGIGMLLKEMHHLQNEHDYYVEELKVSNEKLNRMASIDHLTGLNNHKSFYQIVNDFERLTESSNMCMAMIDIDNFKSVNDTYGHLAGDSILEGLGLILKENVRETDYVARYGGEEFAIVFPNVSLKQSEKLSERLRLIIESHKFIFEDKSIRVTVSTGLSELRKYDKNYVQPFIQSVDALLYQAKNSGKNKVVSASYSY